MRSQSSMYPSFLGILKVVFVDAFVYVFLCCGKILVSPTVFCRLIVF